MVRAMMPGYHPTLSTASSPQPEPSPSISSEINAATRSLHVTLNHLITARLPLALPPYAHDPRLYAIGLRSFAEIYFAFEKAWDTVLDKEKDEKSDEAEQKKKLKTALSRLIPTGLRRTEALTSDLAHLAELQHHKRQTANSYRHDEVNAQLPPIIASLSAHIHTTIPTHPHLIVAYAWVMYMAIFSGGRYIRIALRSAGPDFWDHAQPESFLRNEEQEKEGEELGYSFLNFAGTQDGEDIKETFKTRLAQAEEFLSDNERKEIVEEACRIFEGCVDVVGELDDVVGEMMKSMRPVTTFGALDDRTPTSFDGKNVEMMKQEFVIRSKEFDYVPPTTTAKDTIHWDSRIYLFLVCLMLLVFVYTPIFASGV